MRCRGERGVNPREGRRVRMFTVRQSRCKAQTRGNHHHGPKLCFARYAMQQAGQPCGTTVAHGRILGSSTSSSILQETTEERMYRLQQYVSISLLF